MKRKENQYRLVAFARIKNAIEAYIHTYLDKDDRMNTKKAQNYICYIKDNSEINNFNFITKYIYKLCYEYEYKIRKKKKRELK